VAAKELIIGYATLKRIWDSLESRHTDQPSTTAT
jgi:hypothetical protein